MVDLGGARFASGSFYQEREGERQGAPEWFVAGKNAPFRIQGWKFGAIVNLIATICTS
jgi:hypothetical protein